MREVLVVAARPGQRLARRPRVAAAELVAGHHVVMVHAGVRGHGVRGRVERDQPGRGLRAERDGLTGRVGHRDPAVDGHEPVAADGHLVPEVGDRHPGAVAAEAGHQRGQVAVGVGPGGPGVVVDAVAVAGALHGAGRAAAGAVAGGDEEAAAQAGGDGLAVAGPADDAGVTERAVDGLAARRAVGRAAVGLAGRGLGRRCGLLCGGRAGRRRGGTGQRRRQAASPGQRRRDSGEDHPRRSGWRAG